MEVSPHQLVLIAVGAHRDNRLEGRTRLHKEVYLAQALARLQLVSFRAYLYGPYSDELTDGLGVCLALELATEKRSLQAGWSEFGPSVQYTYALTEEGKELRDTLLDNGGSLARFSQELETVIMETSDLNVSELARAAKIHFIVAEKQDEELSVDNVIQRATSKGWNLGNIDSHVGVLEKLLLVKKIDAP
jgi:uncharacterized protein YwgA